MSVRRVSVRRVSVPPEPARRRGTTPPRAGRSVYEETLRRWAEVLECCAAPDVQLVGRRAADAAAVRAARDATLRRASRWAQLAVEYALAVAALCAVTRLRTAALLALPLLLGAYLAVGVAVEVPRALRRRLSPAPTLVLGLAGWVVVAVGVGALAPSGTGGSPLAALDRVRSRLSAGTGPAPSLGLVPGRVGAAVLALVLALALHLVLGVVVEVAVRQAQAHRRSRDAVTGVADPMVSLLHLTLPYVTVPAAEAAATTIDLLDDAASALTARAARTASWSTWHQLMDVAGRCRRAARDLDLPGPAHRQAWSDADGAGPASDVAAELLIGVLRKAPPFSAEGAAAARHRCTAPAFSRDGRRRTLGTVLPDVLAGLLVLEVLALAGWDLQAVDPGRLVLLATGCGAGAVLLVEAACRLLPLRAGYHRDLLRRWLLERVGDEAPIAERQLLLELAVPDVEGRTARTLLGGPRCAVLAQPATRLVSRIGEVVAAAMTPARSASALVRSFVPTARDGLGSQSSQGAHGDHGNRGGPAAEQLRLSLLQLRGALERGWRGRLRLASWLLSGGLGWVSLHRVDVPAAASSLYLTASAVAGGLAAWMVHGRTAARAVPAGLLVDPAPPARAQRVIDLTGRAPAPQEVLRAPELVRYRGQLSWSVVPGGLRIAIARDAVLPGGHVALDVEGTLAEPVAPFAVLATAEGVDLRLRRVRLDVPVDGRAVYADLAFGRPPGTGDDRGDGDGGPALWLEVSQRGRFVTLARVRLGNDGNGAAGRPGG